MAKNKPQLKPVAKTTKARESNKSELFSKKNYMLTGIAAIVVCLGFILMYSKPDQDIYSFRKITLAPIVVLVGFVIGGFAIFYREKDQSKSES